jgi:hypothetical protein
VSPATPDPKAGGYEASELLELRVIAAPHTAAQAVARLAELVALDRQRGPYPSRKTPGLVRYYLTGRLHPTDTTANAGRGGASR